MSTRLSRRVRPCHGDDERDVGERPCERVSPVHALSFDVEHWHSATLLADEVTDPVDRIHESVDIVLDRLATHDVRATFFVVGEVAESHPDLVRNIAAAGHEIGSHGHTHTALSELTRTAFERELRSSAAAIENAVGRPPVGFRAPNFSVTRGTRWAIPALVASDYRYDSSVFPVKTPMYGVSRAPVRPYVATPEDPFTDRGAASSEGIVEVPMAVAGPRFRLPIAGGFYARLLPSGILLRAIRRLGRHGDSAVVYFHPWEFNPAVRIDTPPVHKRFVSFHRIERTAETLDRLLSAFEWGTVGSVAAAGGASIEDERSETIRRPSGGP